MFSIDVHIDLFCGPCCCFDGASCVLYRHIIPSVIIKGRFGRLNLAGIIWNIVSVSWRIVEPQVRRVVVCAVLMANVCVVRVSKLGGPVSTVCHLEEAIAQI